MIQSWNVKRNILNFEAGNFKKNRSFKLKNKVTVYRKYKYTFIGTPALPYVRHLKSVRQLNGW